MERPAYGISRNFGGGKRARSFLKFIALNYTTYFYFTVAPGGVSVDARRSEKKVLSSCSPETAKIIPLDSNPLIVRGSRLAAKAHFLPTSVCGSGKYPEMPET